MIKNFTHSKYFDTSYGLVLESLDLASIETADDFIKRVENTKNNPYLNVILKKENFEVVDEVLVKDSEDVWVILERATFSFDNGDCVNIYANGSYWWIEASSNGKTEKYFYYTD